ncbi:MAG: DNA methyltransferase [Alphaproteobacteria bacterium]
MKNKLFYGDCLSVMQDKMKPESIDLIYLDPPFNSNKTYNVIYKDSTGRPLPENVEAFCDMWEIDDEKERIIQKMPILMMKSGIDKSAAELWQLWMQALRNTQPKLLAYLAYMTERLLQMKLILKPTGSFFYHCDPTASHYIKIILDAIFGHQNFTNEIVWCYKSGGASSYYFAKKHDIIFYYRMSKENFTYNNEKEKSYMGKNYKTGNKKVKLYNDNKGIYTLVNPKDWWQISMMATSSKKRMGYDTEKPPALLEKIIKASSNEEDIIFDPFCGCATTLISAHKLNRQWVGIDIAYHAIDKISRNRLSRDNALAEGIDYEIDGIPNTMESAMALWEKDKYQFQKFFVEYIGGFVSSKKSNDGGVDGVLYWADEGNTKNLHKMIIEVKGGENIAKSVIRDLRGTMEKTGAQMAGLIVRDIGDIQKRNFIQEMAQAGDYQGKRERPYTRMQLLTIDEIIAGKRFDTPDPENITIKGAKQGVLPVGDTR